MKQQIYQIDFACLYHFPCWHYSFYANLFVLNMLNTHIVQKKKKLQRENEGGRQTVIVPEEKGGRDGRDRETPITVVSYIYR